MRTDIIHYLEEEIRRRCEKESNFFGMGGYHHIRAVVKMRYNWPGYMARMWRW